MSVESLDPRFEGSLPSVSLTQEAHFLPLGLADEAELSEQPIVIEDIVEETAMVSCSAAPREVPSCFSSPASSTVSASAPASTDVSQGSADLMTNEVLLKGNDTRVVSSGYGGSMVQQIQAETTQVVAIIPTKVRFKSLYFSLHNEKDQNLWFIKT